MIRRGDPPGSNTYSDWAPALKDLLLGSRSRSQEVERHQGHRITEESNFWVSFLERAHYCQIFASPILQGDHSCNSQTDPHKPSVNPIR
jgi:hypothetical protein